MLQWGYILVFGKNSFIICRLMLKNLIKWIRILSKQDFSDFITKNLEKLILSVIIEFDWVC